MKPEDYADYLEQHALSANKYAAEDLREIAAWIRQTLAARDAAAKHA